MFDGIAEHEGRKTELANAMFFTKLLVFSLLFFLIHFYLTI